MNNEQEVVVTVSATGKVSVEANGFNGVGCTEATEQIEIALGSKVDREFKPEFHAPATEGIATTLKHDF